MILFVADDHYNSHPGREISDALSKDFKEIKFYENDFSCFTKLNLINDCQLLILNMMGETCDIPLASANETQAVKSYCEAGGNILLLHGASAAFWHLAWWRNIVGLRWVRGNDPDGVQPSNHPVIPYTVTCAKSNHILTKSLKQMVFYEKDEVYINLEQTSACMTLMQTHIKEGTFPQCYETLTQWGGKIIGFLPGHFPVVTKDPQVRDNITILVNYLLSNQ